MSAPSIKRRLIIALLSTSLHATHSAAAGAGLEGTVVSVSDGANITLVDSTGGLQRIRLAAVARLPPGQQGAHRSKESLAALVLEQRVRVQWSSREDDGRIVGQLWVASPDAPCRGRAACPMTLDAGLAQITTGRARWRHDDPQTEQDRGRYQFAEQEARSRKAGLWRNAVRP